MSPQLPSRPSPGPSASECECQAVVLDSGYCSDCGALVAGPSVSTEEDDGGDLAALLRLVRLADEKNLRLDIERDTLGNPDGYDGLRWRVHLHNAWPDDPKGVHRSTLAEACAEVLATNKYAAAAPSVSPGEPNVARDLDEQLASAASGEGDARAALTKLREMVASMRFEAEAEDEQDEGGHVARLGWLLDQIDQLAPVSAGENGEEQR